MNPTTTESPAIVVTAKALIVGDSGVGKSGLVNRLASNAFMATASTRGVSRTRLAVPSGVLSHSAIADCTAELEIWDLAGQPDYNVVHQVFMEDSHVGIIVIDEFRDDPFVPVHDWVRMVEARCPNVHANLLVSARIDRGSTSQR